MSRQWARFAVNGTPVVGKESTLPAVLRYLIFLVTIGSLSSCGLFDSEIEWHAGPYALVGIDTSDNSSIYFDLGGGNLIGRVGSTVFAVGWDGRYLVAKQHPNNDRNQTNYFIVDSKNDGPYVDRGKVVTGPLTALEFQRKANEMKLPGFTKVLKSLE
jgi:hypothetical protein